MSEMGRLVDCLLTHRVYVGHALAAMQGPPERQRYFLPTIRALSCAFEGELRILEIGSWAGISTISWGSACATANRAVRLDCVDPWKPYFDLRRETQPHYLAMTAAAAREQVLALFRHNIRSAGLSEFVSEHIGVSRDVLRQLPSQAFHLVYIDGSHLYEDVAFDIQESKRLVIPGGIIAGDDLEIQATQISPADLAEAVSERRDYVAIPNSDLRFHPGVTAAVGELLGPVRCYDGFWVSQWDGQECHPLELEIRESDVVPEHISTFLANSVAPEPIESYSGYQILPHEGRYVAIYEGEEFLSLRPLLSLLERDIPPAIFLGDSLEQLRTRIAASLHLDQSKFSSQRPALIDEIGEFNVVKVDAGYLAVHRSSGPINVDQGISALLAALGPERVCLATDVDSLRIEVAHREVLSAVRRQVEQLAGPISLTPTAPSPELLGSIANFNVVRVGHQHLAVDKALGPVDLSIGLNEVQRLHGTHSAFPVMGWEGAAHQIALDSRLQGLVDTVRKMETNEGVSVAALETTLQQTAKGWEAQHARLIADVSVLRGLLSNHQSQLESIAATRMQDAVSAAQVECAKVRAESSDALRSVVESFRNAMDEVRAELTRLDLIHQGRIADVAAMLTAKISDDARRLEGAVASLDQGLSETLRCLTAEQLVGDEQIRQLKVQVSELEAISSSLSSRLNSASETLFGRLLFRTIRDSQNG